MLSDHPHLGFKDPNSFARKTFEKRIPWIIQQIIENNELDRDVLKALEEVKANPLELKVDNSVSKGNSLWEKFYQEYNGNYLSNLCFFHAEIYLYEYINSLVDFTSSRLDVFFLIKTMTCFSMRSP